jgi:hypothetical protein
MVITHVIAHEAFRGEPVKLSRQIFGKVCSKVCSKALIQNLHSELNVEPDRIGSI